MLDKIHDWLREEDAARLDFLWRRADAVRRQNVGDKVHLRGLVEIGSFCQRTCLYCGLRAPNGDLPRYRLSQEEILQAAHEASGRGYGTIVLQAGEDPQLDVDWLCKTLRQIKRQTQLAVTLSLGQRDDAELARLREAGADRYLLRFETTNRQLFEKIHPPKNKDEVCDRIGLLQVLRDLDYEVGSGFMIGIPGQSYSDLVEDIQCCAEQGLDMIGVGPYIPHPATPLGQAAAEACEATADQAPASTQLAYKTIALCRLACPMANIPCTTSLATLDGGRGRVRGLQRGANVIMPNLTPREYRHQYEIYPDKAGVGETPADSDALVRAHVQAAGRTIGSGRGDSPNWLGRREQVPSDRPSVNDLQTGNVR